MWSLDPAQSPFQRLGGIFQEKLPEELCSRLRIEAENRVAGFLHSYQKDTWNKVTTGCGAVVEESTSVDETGYAKLRCITSSPYPTPAEDTAVMAYMNPEKLNYYKKTVDTYDAIAKISDNCDLIRTTTKAQLLGMISTREFVDVLCNYRCRDGAFVQHASEAPQEVLDRIPIRPGVIRGRDINTLTVFRPCSEDSTQCCSEQVFQNDPGGSLPSWLVKKATPQTLIDTVKMVRDMTIRFPSIQAFVEKAELRFPWETAQK